MLDATEKREQQEKWVHFMEPSAVECTADELIVLESCYEKLVRGHDCFSAKYLHIQWTARQMEQAVMKASSGQTRDQMSLKGLGRA